MSFRIKAIGLAAGAAMTMAIPFVAHFEGFREAAYIDPTGTPTICYGHTRGVVIGQVKSKAECDILLSMEIERGFRILDKYTDTPLTTEQRVAFASFIYNVGEGNFRRSTLLKKLNAGDIHGACNELPRWVYSKGKKLPGLIRRRKAERKLCLAGESI